MCNPLVRPKVEANSKETLHHGRRQGRDAIFGVEKRKCLVGRVSLLHRCRFLQLDRLVECLHGIELQIPGGPEIGVSNVSRPVTAFVLKLSHEPRIDCKNDRNSP